MKAMLIIDVENCEDCPLFRTSEDFNATIHYCMPYKGKELFMVKEKGISKDCRLKLLPKRKEELYYPCNEYVQAVNEGFNACLDEILGDTEGEKNNV